MNNVIGQPEESNPNQARPNHDRWLGDPRFRKHTFPLVPRTKNPAVKWSTWEPSKKNWEPYRKRRCGLAIKTQKFNIIDGDIEYAPAAKAAKESVFEVLGPTSERFRQGSSRFSLLC